MVRGTLTFKLQFFNNNQKKKIPKTSFFEPGIPVPYSENFQTIE